MSRAVPALHLTLVAAALRPSDPLLDGNTAASPHPIVGSHIPLRAFELVPFENADALPAKRSSLPLRLSCRLERHPAEQALRAPTDAPAQQQLAALFHFAKQPPRLGRVILDTSSKVSRGTFRQLRFFPRRFHSCGPACQRRETPRAAWSQSIAPIARIPRG